MDILSERSHPTPLSNSSLLPLLLLSLTTQRHTPYFSKTLKEEYDYIIVGGGTAGSVVAARLSEVPCVNVLLLEAGREPPILTEVPGLARYFRQSDTTWEFLTVPQKHTASGMKNRQVKWITGKMLGGAGSLNGMAYVRGNRLDYDFWAAAGATGWSYQDVFPYFLKLEDNRNLAYLNNGYHAAGGPVTVDSPSYYPELKHAVYEAATELGYEFVDANAAKQTGFYEPQAFIRDDQRCSSVKSHLVPAENRTNLDILTNAIVTKVIIENGQAKGVEYQSKGKIHRVKSRHEVIISSGTENSPKILMLSGVGPQDELEKLDIPLVTDLPVGKNLHDDAGTFYPFTLDERFISFEEKIKDPANIMQYINNRSGPLAALDALTIAFMSRKNESAAIDYPDYELYIQEVISSFTRDARLKEEVYEQIFGPYENKALFSCTVQQLRPKSRGTITLSSSDPFSPIVIDPDYLEDPEDIYDIIEGLKMCKKLVNTEALRKLGAKAIETIVPGCEDVLDNDDDYFRCVAATILFTFHHPVGTCKMGDANDPTTVVDPELRVKNVKGLRVVDASIMPVVTVGNTYIPTIMIAEKASDMIKETIECLGLNAFS